MFVAKPAEEFYVHEQIDRALMASSDWAILGVRVRAVSPDEQPLAERLLAAPTL